MFQDPDHFRTVSLKLSDVLSDIGVNKKMVMKRRRLALLNENLYTTTYRYNHLALYRFGSQSEGSTTLGLQSDNDELFCCNKYNVIQDIEEWQPGMLNLLTIQNETVSPGYCLLQLLSVNEPLPVREPHTVSGENVLLKNSFLIDRLISIGLEQNGPAASLQGVPGFMDTDNVFALPCKTWPKEASIWLVRESLWGWPTEEMKKYCESKGFFVVSVSSKSGLNQETEWRISTSVAERCLMFSLNMTQLRCYILMKMIVKTFINPRCYNVVSSFICKTVLFYCISGTRKNNWRESNLLACMIFCITVLQKFVCEQNCPHFIIPENNLLAGKMSPQNRIKILEILQYIVQSEGRALLEIPYDDLGTRLNAKINMMNEAIQLYESPAKVNAVTSILLLLDIATGLSVCRNKLIKDELYSENEIVQAKLSHFVLTFTNIYTDMASNTFDKTSAKLLIPLLSSALASVKAAREIHETRTITSESFLLFSRGLNSDVASGRLKLASALYCLGDLERAEFILMHTEEKYDLTTIEPVCGCYNFRKAMIKQKFENKCMSGQEALIQQIMAFCVIFMRCELHCVPKELQYEMFRSTQEELQERNESDDFWMDMAVVDSLPFLYFLQYKTYDALQRVAGKALALAKLATTIYTEEPNLGHRETALNLLGQCMEQENRHNDALNCYLNSLTIRRRNNAANWHICRLMHSLINI